MKIKELLETVLRNKLLGPNAFWFNTQTNEIYKTHSHSDSVLKNPEKFGITPEEIEPYKSHAQFDETLVAMPFERGWLRGIITGNGQLNISGIMPVKTFGKAINFLTNNFEITKCYIDLLTLTYDSQDPLKHVGSIRLMDQESIHKFIKNPEYKPKVFENNIVEYELSQRQKRNALDTKATIIVTMPPEMFFTFNYRA